MKPVTQQVKDLARAAGFDLVGVASAAPPTHWQAYEDWLGRGFGGQMAYLARNLDRRGDPRAILPGARSILCVGALYHPGPSDGPGSEPTGQISSYARGDDYHDVMTPRLQAVLDEIRKRWPDTEGKVYVDTGPVLERDFAEAAGLGWFGKHTNLIHQRSGSFFFIGEILLTLDLQGDAPTTDHCGTCVRCIEACPTDAIVAPYELDSRKCISYLTIELKGAIPKELRTGVGDWIYGCDVCQDVCPWNEKHGQTTEDPALAPKAGRDRPVLADLLRMNQAEFSRTFSKSPVKRTKRRGLLRNAAVALGNTGGEGDVPVLGDALVDEEPLVRGHAAWALGQIGGDEAKDVLTEALKDEGDECVRVEIEDALSAIGTE